MQRRTACHLLGIVLILGTVALMACAPVAPNPPLSTPQVLPQVSPQDAPGHAGQLPGAFLFGTPRPCTAAEAAGAPAPRKTLTTSEAQATATYEFDAAPLRGPEGQVPMTTVEQSGAGLIITTVEVATAEEASELAARATEGNDLLSIEADRPVHALETDGQAVVAAVSDDPLRSSQWALDQVPFESAWTTSNGAGVTVAVIDSGVQNDHPDLAGQVMEPGQNFTGGDPENTADNNGHGTHVAGIIAAVANNQMGIAGAAPGVEILPVKVLDASGMGTNAQVASGISWAADNGADVINLSLGSSTSSSSVAMAIDYAVGTKGVLVFAAAGNDGMGGLASYPGADTNAIGVASVTQQLARSSFSTTGSYVDVAAPGSQIWSTLPPDGYGVRSGTSMSTPYAAAAGALLDALHPTWSVADLRERLLTTADDLGYRGKDAEFGCGLVDPLEAVS